jgi:hypothetical protein
VALKISVSPLNFLPTSENPLSIGVRRCWVGSLSGDTSYPSGGYVLDPNLLGLDRVGHVIVPPDSSLGFVWVWSPSTSKLQAFALAGTEVSGGTDLSASPTSSVLVIAH